MATRFLVFGILAGLLAFVPAAAALLLGVRSEIGVGYNPTGYAVASGLCFVACAILRASENKAMGTNRLVLHQDAEIPAR